MRAKVTHGIGELASDLAKIQAAAPKKLRGVVVDGIRAGNELAKQSARRHNPAGSHSKQYPGKFSAAMLPGRGLFGNTYSGEYGPRAEGQGNLAPILENGSRNGNAAQLNLAKSVDVIGPQFPREVQDVLGDLFWPKS